MSVGIDSARHDVAVRRIERTVALKPFADRLDGLAFYEHVGLVGPVGGDDRSAFDDQRHVGNSSPLFSRAHRSGTGAIGGHDTISAFSSTACMSTLAPAVDHSCLMSSLSLWLTPSTQGVK